MLTITEAAVGVLVQTRTEKGEPDDSGVRFFTREETDSDRTRLAFKFVDSPRTDDTVLDEKSIDAYVAPEVDRLIGDVVVDARESDGRLGLVVRRERQQA